MDPLTPEKVMANLNAASNRRWYDVKNEGSKASIRIYESIGGYFGVWASEFAEEIAALEVDEIEVQLNSPGGSVFEGLAIYNALRAHPAKIVTRVDGLAASIASVIVQAGDERHMMSGAQMMIHNAQGGMYGGADELRKFADVVEQQNNVIAGVYAEASGRDTDDFLVLMDDETWMTADEAVSEGLADKVIAPAKADDADASTGDNDPEPDARFDSSLSLALLNL